MRIRGMKASTAVGLIAIISGVLWLCIVAAPMLVDLAQDHDALFLLFGGVVFAMFALPAAFGVWLGVQAIKTPSKEIIKATVGILLVIPAILVTGLGQALAEYLEIPLTRTFEVSSLVACCLAVAVYTEVCKFVFNRDGIPHAGDRELYGKFPAFLIAWCVLGVGIQLVNEHLDFIRDHHSEILLPLPFLVAWGFYVVSRRLICGKAPKPRRPREFHLNPPDSTS